MEKVTSRYLVTKEELYRMQNKDEDLKSFAEKKEADAEQTKPLIP